MTETQPSIPDSTTSPNRKAAVSGLLIKLYSIKALRKYVLSIARKLEGGDFYSQTIRDIYSQFHSCTIGNYSYGCFNTNAFPPGTRIGNYVSIAENVVCLRRNHPYQRITQHPFFYNRHLGIVANDTIENNIDNPLVIGHDVWIGRNTTILPGCKLIGNGSIIGAGSIVTKDIPPFSIAAGNPAKVIKERFSEECKNAITKTQWWDYSIADLIKSELPNDQNADLPTIEQWDSRLKKTSET